MRMPNRLMSLSVGDCRRASGALPSVGREAVGELGGAEAEPVVADDEARDQARHAGRVRRRRVTFCPGRVVGTERAGEPEASGR